MLISVNYLFIHKKNCKNVDPLAKSTAITNHTHGLCKSALGAAALLVNKNQWRRHGGGFGGQTPPIDDWKKPKTALFGPIGVFSYRDCVFLCCIKLPIQSRETFIVMQ